MPAYTIHTRINKLQVHNKHLLSLLLIVITSAALFAKYYGAWIWLDYDVGRELLIPAKLAKGEILYKDVFYWYGPVSVYLNSFAMQLFGIKLDVIYVIGLTLTTVTAFSIYLITYRFTDCSWAILAALLFVAHGMIAPEGSSFVMPYSFAVSYGSTFLTAGVCMILYHHKNKRLIILFLACISLSLSFASKLEFIPPVIMAAALYTAILLYEKSAFSPFYSILLLLLTPVLGLAIWLAPSISSGLSALLSNIYHQEMLDYHFKNGVLFNVIRSYSPTVIMLGVKGSIIIFGLISLLYSITWSTRIKISEDYILVVPIIIIAVLILNIDLDIANYTKRVYPLINIAVLLLLLMVYLRTKELSVANIFMGYVALIALSLYTRQSSVYGIWQSLSYGVLVIFLYKVSNKLPLMFQKIQRAYLNSALALALVVLIISGIVNIPYQINQRGELTTISAQGGNLVVDSARGNTISKAVNELSDIKSSKISFGPELGWLSVLTHKIDPIRATQWWVYLEPEIIKDLEAEHIEYLVFYYSDSSNFFDYKYNMDELKAYVHTNFSLHKRFRGDVTIDIYQRE